MTDLERRALMGDKEAQEECTEKGIVLPCPCCGGQAKMKKGFPSRQVAHCRQAVVQCKTCGVRTVTYKQLPMERWQDVDKMALQTWNTRTPPPIGRCETCQHLAIQDMEDGGYEYCNTAGGLVNVYNSKTCYCSEHKSKEET